MIILIYSFLFSAIAAILHICVNSFLRVSERESPIHNVIRQLRLISVLWVVLFPVLFYVAFKLSPLHIDLSYKALGVFNYLSGIILFSFLFFIYLSIYYIFDRSVSSEIMIAIEASKDKALSLLEIKKLYQAQDKCDNELKGMLEGGFIFQEKELYKNTIKGAIFAKYAFLCKRLYKIGLGGY